MEAYKKQESPTERSARMAKKHLEEKGDKKELKKFVINKYLAKDRFGVLLCLHRI